MFSDLSEEELYSEEEEVDSDQFDPIPDKSLCTKFMGLQPYSFEPERDQASRVPAEVDESFPPNIEMEEISEARAGNKDWCLCEACQVEERNLDCLCCHEEASITDKKFDGM